MEITIHQTLQQSIKAHQEGKLEEAEKLYREILKNEPKHVDANHNLGLIKISQNKSAEAIPLLKIAVETNPSIEQFWVSYTTALINEKQFEEAESCCRKAIKQKVNSAKIYFNLGITLNELGRLEESEESYKIAIEIKSDYAEAYNNLGNTLLKLDRFERAIVSLKKAIEINPDYAEAYYNLGISLQKLERLKEAEKCFKKTIQIKPDFAEAHKYLGYILQRLGRLEEAEKCYKTAIQIKPDYAEAFNNLGSVIKDLNRLDEAEKCYKKAIEFKPNYEEAHSNLGVVLKGLNKLDEAEKCYRKAIEFNPFYFQVYYNLGKLLQDLRKLDEAEACYKKAIEINPKYEDASYNLNILLQEKELLLRISNVKKKEKKTKVNFSNLSNISSNKRLISNPFISKRKVEAKLITDIYKIKTKELDKTKDARFGNGRCSEFDFLKNSSQIIKNVADDLINIMKHAVKSDIYIKDSFLNIYGAGSGTKPHSHINDFDKNNGLVNQKFSLTYYLSVGDQNCKEPGNLKIYDLDEEILLSDGTIVIIPASRRHSAVYDGKLDRVMIGVNFYSLL